MPSAPQALERVRDALARSSAPLPAHAPLIAQLRSARDFGRTAVEAAAEAPPPLATTVAAVDDLLAGGLPRGQLVELIGGRSSGRFSTVLAALAAATMAGESAALVDLGDGLDPQAAITLGVDLPRLLWLRPSTLKQALACAEILIGGGFSLVALELGPPPVPGGRGLEAAWLRLARAAQAHHTALLIASPYRVSGTAAAAVLQATRARVLWQGLAPRHHTHAAETGAPAAGMQWTSQDQAADQAASPLLSGLAAAVTLEKRRNQAPSAAQTASPLTLWLPEAAALLDPLPSHRHAALPASARAAIGKAARPAGVVAALSPSPAGPASLPEEAAAPPMPLLSPAATRYRRRTSDRVSPRAALAQPPAAVAAAAGGDLPAPRAVASGYRRARRG
jgi:recA bacterial DNA recombination protein